ncbi:ribonuclease Z [Paenibacillus sp. 1011MAR3C5]|uniref:MBL fold metallo-hydrolase n=1 Tax=Paenibacillus sp. 1011MAR3C5 TaxID=1675787 RepID=UPI000E6D4079|nr:MBL fold metallo-hydrolase [Paenibacillus sp. 1011MAR3C5]RJE90620.1 ribonuclease Z [Paenibacillus sp. 1011MAR3C5]
MQITMLGTGSAFAKRYYNNNALIEVGGYQLLLDCGITLPKALHEADLDFSDLDGVLISHIHADHVGGLEEYAFQMLFKHQRKPVLYIAEPLVEPLWDHTLRGGLTQGNLTKLSDFFDVRALKPDKSVELAPGLHVEPFQTKHIEGKASFSFRFNHRFFYTADMIFDAPLLERLVQDGVEIIYHDCQLEPPGVVHATLDELLQLPEAIQQKVRLMHYGDAMEQHKARTGPMRFVEQRKTYEV